MNDSRSGQGKEKMSPEHLAMPESKGKLQKQKNGSTAKELRSQSPNGER